MEEAEILDSQSRQEKISQIERDSIRDTTISDSINDISLTDESVNFMQTRRGDGKFNSTMKNGTRTTLQATNKATTSTTTTLTTSAKTGAYNRTSSTDAGSRDTGTSPDGLSMTLSLSTTQETRT